MEGSLLSKYFLRLLTANLLPTPILTWVKKHYYAGDVEKFWEDDVVPVRELVKPGDFVIDMGANFGWYTNVLSTAVGPSGKVYSIEPIPDTFQVLSGVIQKLGLKNVLPLNLLKEAAKHHEVHALLFDQPASRPPNVKPQDCVEALLTFCASVDWVSLPQDSLGLGRYWRAFAALLTGEPYEIRWLRSSEMVSRLKCLT